MMKCRTLPFIFLFSVLSLNLMAQWDVLVDNVIPQNYRVWSIKVATDQSIWALSTFDNFPPTDRLPIVHKSSDKGLTWSNQEVSGALSNYGWDISPLDSLHAFIALGNGGLYQTSDGGAVWGKVQSYNHNARAVHFFNAEEGVVVGTDASNFILISITSDGGSHWKHLGGRFWFRAIGTSLPSKDPSEFLPAFTFSVNSSYDYKGNTIIIGTSKGEYWISTDKGWNWTRKRTPLSDLGLVLSNVAMKDAKNFLVAGDIDANTREGRTTVSFSTQDGGKTWRQGAPGVTAAASHYIPESDGTYIMVGHNDFGWGRAGTAISYDYGVNWEIVDNTSLIALDFVDGSVGVGVCCNNGWPTAKGQIVNWNFDTVLPARDLKSGNWMNIWPNPAKDVLKVEFNEGLDSREIEINIVASNGQIMEKFKRGPMGQFEVNISRLPKGSYSLQVISGRRIVVGKFIKE